MKLAEVRTVRGGGVERKRHLRRMSASQFEWEEFGWEKDDVLPLEAPLSIDGVSARLLSVQKKYGIQEVVAQTEVALEPLHTARLSNPSFREALESASAEGYFLYANDATEAPDYWVFPVSEIGVLAMAVDKKTRISTVLSSRYRSLELALAAYEERRSLGQLPEGP